MGMGIFMGIPIPMGWENFFSSGNPYTNLHGNLVGIPIGILLESCGNTHRNPTRFLWEWVGNGN